MIDHDSNAYPISQADGRYNPLEAGLTKREYFAAMSMKGILSARPEFIHPQVCADDSVRYADALIAALSDPTAMLLPDTAAEQI